MKVHSNMTKLITIEDVESGNNIYVNPENITVVFQTLRQDAEGNPTDQLVTVLSLTAGHVATPEKIEDVLVKIKGTK